MLLIIWLKVLIQILLTVSKRSLILMRLIISLIEVCRILKWLILMLIVHSVLCLLKVVPSLILIILIYLILFWKAILIEILLFIDWHKFTIICKLTIILKLFFLLLLWKVIFFLWWTQLIVNILRNSDSFRIQIAYIRYKICRGFEFIIRRSWLSFILHITLKKISL